MQTTEIPRVVPTREEIAVIGARNVIVATALKFFRHGLTDYETTLRIAIVALVEQNEKLVEQEIRRNQTATSISLELTEKQLHAMRQKADDDEQAAALREAWQRSEQDTAVRYLISPATLPPVRTFLGALVAGAIAIFFLYRWAMQ